MTILTGPGDYVGGFHHRALAELYRRRGLDFEVSDLFAGQLPERSNDRRAYELTFARHPARNRYSRCA